MFYLTTRCSRTAVKIRKNLCKPIRKVETKLIIFLYQFSVCINFEN